MSVSVIAAGSSGMLGYEVLKHLFGASKHQAIGVALRPKSRYATGVVA